MLRHRLLPITGAERAMINLGLGLTLTAGVFMGAFLLGFALARL